MVALALGCLALAGALHALDPKKSDGSVSSLEFFEPELYISMAHEPLAEVQSLLPNRDAWDGFQAAHEASGAGSVQVFIDPRSGTASNVMGAFPLIPGDGVGNRVGLDDLGARLGYAVQKVDLAVVGDALAGFLRDHQAALGIDLSQLGKVRGEQVSPHLWQLSIPQTYQGIPVRHGRLAASVSHGNLIVVGTETWGNVRGLSTKPSIGSDRALEIGFEHLGGRLSLDRIVRPVALEVVPVAPPEHQVGEGFGGPLGDGYRHRLVWTFAFVRPPESGTFEMLVDAHSGQILSLQDLNQYAGEQITGGVYPVTSTEICPTPGTCGTMQTGWPMPFTDTGLASPNNFTNSAGVFDWPGGTVTTTLTGRYVDIVDSCGAVSNSSTTGNLNLGGTNGQHDCTTAGGSAGNTASSRSAFYEINKIAELARGWLPSNTWLQNRLTTRVNLTQTCNAYWDFTAVNFFRSGGGCRNTGELAGVFDHEWGHGMDDNDAAGALSNTSEAYADIAAIFRLQASCVGHGFWWTSNKGCGQTVDGTGFNCNEAQTGAAVCCTDCSGVRDADYAKHTAGTPATALGFVCTSCLSSSGPCGRQVHCSAAPPRQAAWDLVTRDLTSAPFNLDSQTAFLIGNRLFYLGSGNIGTWYACTCGSSSNGCGATNAYMQWITADDDNGNLNDGTPHMTAIFNAFNRHGIACTTPTATNSGCATGPTTAPTLTATAGDRQVALSWNAVSGASRYWVMRTEGHAGCNYGKTRIADITGTTYTDTQVANGRQYHYNVVAQGSSAACFTPVSTCQSVTPAASVTPDFTISTAPASLTISQGSSGTSTTTVTSVNGFSSAVTLSCTGAPAGVSCGFSTNPVTPPGGGSATSTLTVTVGASTAFGTYNMTVQGVSGSLNHSTPLTLTVPAPGPVTVFFDNFETDLGWTRNPNSTDTATAGLWERGDPETTTSSGTKQLGTTVSGTNDLVTGRLAGASAGVHDVDGGVTSIQSPAITLPASGTITLSFSYYMAHLNNSSSADYLRVFVIGSTTSTVLEELNAANDDDAVWATASINISSFAGQTIRIRIDAADTSTASLVEAAVDDVRITQQ
ncbi:MAG TPA: endopeptidase [Thermoanaerobaculia bacterium]|nr:endopeptidase [Thermoanaerobaculia bacterium]